MRKRHRVGYGKWMMLGGLGLALAALAMTQLGLTAQAKSVPFSIRGIHAIFPKATGLTAQAKSAPTSVSHATVRFWVQTMDSCKQAIPGAFFVLQGNGLNVAEGPGPGNRPVTVANSAGCPLQRGNCVTVPTGCLVWNIPVPAQGSTQYQIRETHSPANYEPCTGGSVCPGGPQVITLTVRANATVSATVYNVYPDRNSVTWGPYTGTQTDPAVVHDFGIGNGSCDGDHDADDHLTGSPSNHCDSDNDRRHTSGF